MITIQKPTVEDVREIVMVLYETWLVTFPNEAAGITKEDIDERFKDRLSDTALQKRTAEILNGSDNQIIIIAKDDDKVIGMCRAIKAQDVNELAAIYVLPDYQRSGIGQMFWARVKEFFGDEKDIIVHLATYNSKALNFYQKLGFVDFGKRLMQENLRMPVSGNIIPEMELVIKSKK